MGMKEVIYYNSDGTITTTLMELKCNFDKIKRHQNAKKVVQSLTGVRV